MLAAAAVLAQGNAAGAADHQDAGGRAAGAPEGRAFIAGHEQAPGRQGQRRGGQGLALVLHGAAGLDATGADGGGCQGQVPPGGGQLLAGRRQAGGQCRLETLRAAGCRQVTDTGSLPLGEHLESPGRSRLMQARGTRRLGPGQQATGMGLAGIKARQQTSFPCRGLGWAWHGARGPRWLGRPGGRRRWGRRCRSPPGWPGKTSR